MGKSKAGSKGSVSSSQELKQFLEHRWWKKYSVHMLAIGGIMVAIFSSTILQFASNNMEIVTISASDAAQLHQVFKSGEAWVVQCAKADSILDSVFTKASKKLLHTVNMGVMDCTEPLPSGKSVLDRFGIRNHIEPTVFTVANGGKPKQIFLNHLKSPKLLRRQVHEQTKKTLVEVHTSEQLRAKCMEKKSCLLILRGQKFTAYDRQWLQDLMHNHRKSTFAWIDSTLHKLSIEAGLPKYVAGQNRLVAFSSEKNEKGSTIVAAKAYRSDFDQFPVAQFVDSLADEQFKDLKSLPTVSKRVVKVPKKEIPKSSSVPRNNAETADKESAAKKPTETEQERRERMDRESSSFYALPEEDVNHPNHEHIVAVDEAEEEEVVLVDEQD